MLETSTSTWGFLGAYISMLRDAGPANIHTHTLNAATWYFALESSPLAKQGWECELKRAKLIYLTSKPLIQY